MDIVWQKGSTKLPTISGGSTDARINVLLDQVSGGSGRAGAAKELREMLDGWRRESTDAMRHYAGLASAGQMASMVFDQLKHPLRQIRSDLDLAIGDLDCEEIDADLAQDIQACLVAALRRLDTMEKRMDNLDPLAVGGRGRRVGVHDLHDLFEPVFNAFRPAFASGGVALEVSAANDAPSAATNDTIAQQVLANLLDNALHFASSEEARAAGVVHVMLREGGFEVWDNGPGIADDLVPHLFEPHFTTREGAHGVGLTLARDLLATINGRVELVDPETARFRVRLGEG